MFLVGKQRSTDNFDYIIDIRVIIIETTKPVVNDLNRNIYIYRATLLNILFSLQLFVYECSETFTFLRIIYFSHLHT